MGAGTVLALYWQVGTVLRIADSVMQCAVQVHCTVLEEIGLRIWNSIRVCTVAVDRSEVCTALVVNCRVGSWKLHIKCLYKWGFECELVEY